MEYKNLELILEQKNNSNSVVLITEEHNFSELHSAIKEMNFTTNVLIENMNDICLRYVEAFKSHTELAFAEALIEQKMLIIDNVQYLINRIYTQSALAKILKKRKNPTIIILNKELYANNKFIPEIEEIFCEYMAFEFVVNGNFGLLKVFTQ